MLNVTGQKSALFSLVIPTLALLVSASIVAFPALRAYVHLKHAPRTIFKIDGRDEVYVLMGEFQAPADRIGGIARDLAATQQEPAITLLNAPGYLVYVLVGMATGHEARWAPVSIFPPLWRVLIIPFCALPAWWLVGRGMDGFFRRRRLRRGDMIASFLLLLGSAAISAGLRFGLTTEERAGGDARTACFIAGFAWWTALFAIPLAAWLFQRTRALRAT